MPKLKKAVSKDFTTIHNAMVKDKQLGINDRGLLLTMLSLPDNWNFSIKGLMCILPDGYTRISTALKHLEELGYLVRERIYEDGKIVDWEYIFSDEPIYKDEDQRNDSPSQESGNLELENLESENLILGNQVIENHRYNKINSNQISNNKILFDKQSVDQSGNDGLTDGYMLRQKEYTDLVKANIEYEDYVEWIKGSNGYMTVKELDDIVAMIVRAVCSDKPDETICGQRHPREVIRSTMLRVDRECLENAIEQMKMTDNIRNHEKYLISTLFNEVNGKTLKDNTEERNAEYTVRRDMAIIDQTQLHRR